MKTPHPYSLYVLLGSLPGIFWPLSIRRITFLRGSLSIISIWLFLTFWGGFSVPLFAQQSVLDSLEKELAQTATDSSRLLLINQIAIHQYRTQPDSVFQLLSHAIASAKKEGYRRPLFELYLTLGKTLEFQNQRDRVVEIYQMANELAVDLEDKKRLALALQRLGYGYNMYNKKRKSIQVLEEALQLAIEAQAPEAQAAILNQMGNVFSYLAAFDTADIIQHKALKIAEASQDQKFQALILRHLGNNAARSNHLKAAINYYEQALDLNRILGDKIEESLVLRMMGYSCHVMGQYPLALDYYQKALEILKHSDDKKNIAACLRDIARVYTSLNAYPDALSYLEKADSFLLGEVSENQRASTLLEKVEIYLLKEDYTTAIQILQKSLAFRKAAGQFENAYGQFINLGKCYEKINQLDSADHYYQMALEAAIAQNSTIEKCQSQLSLGRLKYLQNNFDAAILYLKGSIQFARLSGSKEQEMEASQLLYELYKEQNLASLALQYHEAYQNLKDSVFNVRGIKQIAQLEANYEFEQEKQALQFAQSQKLKRERTIQYVMLAALLAAFLIILTIGWYYQAKQKINKRLNRLNSELVEQKNIVEDQNRKLAELDQTKSRFFTNISHEFRTPLTIIGGMIQQVVKSPEKWLQKGGQLIARNNAQLLHLVNQILDLRKLESGNLQLEEIQGDIISYLRYILESFQSLGESKELRLHFLSKEDELWMDYDKEKILRVVSNLLSNAMKFTPKGGDVYLIIESRESSVDNLRLTTHDLRLKVKDTGIGIPKDKIPYIFDRFYQADDSTTREGEGTGIGLALTKELIKLMEGTIEVESEEGKGTSFRVILPISREAEREEKANNDQQIVDNSLPHSAIRDLPSNIHYPISSQQPASSDQRPAPGTQSTLLIIEDNPGVVEYLESLLADKYHLEIARDGQEGIEIALGSHTRPDPQ